MVIREIEPGDAAAAAELCAELGYPCEVDVMRERIQRVASSNDCRVLVACDAEGIAGWIDISIAHHLAAGVYGEIAGLIVAGNRRSQGIGRQLLAEAERWLVEREVGTIVVRSRVTREDAHRFYLREGYTITKTSAVFSKQLLS